MVIKVNLLKKSRVLTEKQYQLERKVLVSSVIMFVVVICATIAFFAWQVFVSSRVSALDQTIAQANAQLAGMQETNIQQLYIKSRLKLVSGLFEGREITREALRRVIDLALPGVAVSSIVFEESNILKIQVTARDASSFETVYKYFEDTKDFFVSVVNNGVVRATDGAYVMTLSLYTPQITETKDK